MYLTITISTHKKEELLEITGIVKQEVTKSQVKNGICIVFAPHTTCGLIINENADPSVCKDIITGLNKFLPHDALRDFMHAEGNSPAHIKSSLVGQHQVLLVENGEIVLGTWQGLYLVEFDGPRTRTVLVRIVATGD